jgi:hypothetical protein
VLQKRGPGNHAIIIGCVASADRPGSRWNFPCFALQRFSRARMYRVLQRAQAKNHIALEAPREQEPAIR